MVSLQAHLKHQPNHIHIQTVYKAAYAWKFNRKCNNRLLITFWEIKRHSSAEFQALKDMEMIEDSLIFRTFDEFWGWNNTSVLDLTVASFQSEPDAPSVR